MEEKILYRIHIRGRVQGVGFRYNAVKEANIRGLTGYVKNLYDGSVYIEAEGIPGMLDDFMEWCRAGPVFANVESVEYNSFPPEGYTEFRAVK